MRKKLIIIRGLPGSGKSRLAMSLLSALRYRIIRTEWYEADMYFINPDGEYKFKAAHLNHAHAWCQRSVDLALDDDECVIVSNTACRYWEIKPYIEMAKKYNAELHIIKCEASYESIHSVPQATLDKMASHWEDMDDEIIYNSQKEPTWETLLSKHLSVPLHNLL